MSWIADIRKRLLLSPLGAQARLSPLMTIILAALGFMTLLVTLFALYALLGPTGAETEGAGPDWKSPTLAIVELEPPKPDSADVQTLTRPIFSKSRKPFPKSAARPASEAVVASTAPSGVTVAAIVRKGKIAQAFVLSPDAPEGAWRKIGDTVDSWTIKAIAADELTLRNGGAAATLKLYSDAAVDEPPDAPNPSPLGPQGQTQSFPPPPPPAPPPPGAPPQFPGQAPP